jgi:outer membrane lipoprotein-sorting protein
MKGFVSAASIAALLACGALAPASARAETWAELSKKMHDECATLAKGVQDMTITMEMRVPSSDCAITTESVLYRKGARYRVEATLGGTGDAGVDSGLADLTTIVIGNGSDAWVIAPMVGTSKIPLEEGRKYRGEWMCSDYLPIDAEIVGSDTAGGRACYVLSVLDAGSDIARLWLDRKSYALVKLQGKPSEGETMTAIFSDFETVPGLGELPHRSDVYSGPDLISTVIVKSIEVNTGLSDDLFDAEKVKVKGGGAVEMLKKMKEAVDKQRVD